jgi:hypothetical protein
MYLGRPSGIHFGETLRPVRPVLYVPHVHIYIFDVYSNSLSF